jgi:hypothetical protein
MSKQNRIRMKIDFENTPIFDTTQIVKNEADFDDMTKQVKNKLFGK